MPCADAYAARSTVNVKSLGNRDALAFGAGAPDPVSGGDVGYGLFRIGSDRRGSDRKRSLGVSLGVSLELR